MLLNISSTDEYCQRCQLQYMFYNNASAKRVKGSHQAQQCDISNISYNKRHCMYAVQVQHG